ncbi:UMP kinase [Sulfolobales archaeon SCGC AB-777_K20]|nr:UMP kinase [Sulfolobales archaeon SCGC AB-777_K20]
MTLTLKLTGKLFESDELVDVLKAVKDLSEKEDLAVVTGGGGLARRYIAVGRSLGLNEGYLDLLGIEPSRMNALLVALYLDGYKGVPRSLEEFVSVWSFKRPVVAGGFQPGQSTAGVASLIAEATGSRELILATTVDSVYDADPRKYPNARPLKEVRLSELMDILARDQDVKAGTYELIDPLAAKVLMRAKIRVRVLHYRDMRRYLQGEDVGSRVVPE